MNSLQIIAYNNAISDCLDLIYWTWPMEWKQELMDKIKTMYVIDKPYALPLK